MVLFVWKNFKSNKYHHAGKKYLYDSLIWKKVCFNSLILAKFGEIINHNKYCYIVKDSNKFFLEIECKKSFLSTKDVL